MMDRPVNIRRRRVLAVASYGGHWIQLFRMRKSWSGCDVDYICTNDAWRETVSEDARSRLERMPNYHVVPEANRWQKLRMAWLFLSVAMIVLKRRPDVIISTGAAPGYFAIRVGRLIGAKTIWVDSIANAQELSLSGRHVREHADVWLTQWQHLAAADGPQYWGAVL